MTDRRTDDGTYPNVEEELAKIDDRAAAAADVPGPYRAVADAERAAREPLETEHDDAPRAELAGGDDDVDELVRRAEVRLEPITCSDESAMSVSIALEDFADGARELVVLAIDENDAEAELARVDARALFAAIDRLRAFGVDPNPPRERTPSDVHAALEGLVGELAPAILAAVGVRPPPAPPRPPSPLRPVPGGRSR
jgi:hypothetical protein